MKRYLITGEAGAVRTLSDILSEPPYDWLVATDDGSSQRAILTMMEGLPTSLEMAENHDFRSMVRECSQ